METTDTVPPSRPPLSKFIIGGLISGVVSTVLNNFYGFGYTALTGFRIPEVINVVSITSASMITTFVGALIYFALSRFTEMANLFFMVGGIVFALLSFVVPFSPTLPNGAPTPAGFAGLTAPMHLMAGIACVVLVPLFVHKMDLIAQILNSEE